MCRSLAQTIRPVYERINFPVDALKTKTIARICLDSISESINLKYSDPSGSIRGADTPYSWLLIYQPPRKSFPVETCFSITE